jgi:hypothetical protein
MAANRIGYRWLVDFLYALYMSTRTGGIPGTPEWATAMEPGHWCRISGDAPDLDLPPTPIGTRYLVDNDPARGPNLNPPKSMKERTHRLAGRD